MAEYTRLTNLEVTGTLKADKVNLDLTENTYKVTSTDATAAAGDNPTAAEFAKVVTLVNEIKADYNKLLKQIITGSDT